LSIKIVIKLSDIISTILRNTGMTNGVSNVVILLNFIKNNCSYDKFNKIDLSDLLSNYYIARFPFVNLDDFYDGEKDIELLEQKELLHWHKLDSLKVSESTIIKKEKILIQIQHDTIKVIDTMSVSELQKYFTERYNQKDSIE
jgi:hypothetical protein